MREWCDTAFYRRRLGSSRIGCRFCDMAGAISIKHPAQAACGFQAEMDRRLLIKVEAVQSAPYTGRALEGYVVVEMLRAPVPMLWAGAGVTLALILARRP